MLAYCRLRLNDPKGSLVKYTRSAALARPSSADLQNVAKDYALLNDLPDADHWMTLAVKMDPKDAEAWYGLGRIRFTQQRFQDAADCFERALVLDPRNVKAEYNLGLSYEGLNRTDDATSAYRNAIGWQQGSPHPSAQPLLNLGIMQLHQGRLPVRGIRSPAGGVASVRFYLPLMWPLSCPGCQRTGANIGESISH